ncbi:hypothetical protein AGR1B_pa0210 [Agrobacterium fabacearum S56]|nr:hypothetical protein AGR1B_pa0210 [Agrobacterium fabacearum S56]
MTNLTATPHGLLVEADCPNQRIDATASAAT